MGKKPLEVICLNAGESISFFDAVVTGAATGVAIAIVGIGIWAGICLWRWSNEQ